MAVYQMPKKEGLPGKIQKFASKDPSGSMMDMMAPASAVGKATKAGASVMSRFMKAAKRIISETSEKAAESAPKVERAGYKMFKGLSPEDQLHYSLEMKKAIEKSGMK